MSAVLTARRNEKLELSPFQQRVSAVPEEFNIFLGGGRGGAHRLVASTVNAEEASNQSEKMKGLGASIIASPKTLKSELQSQLFNFRIPFRTRQQQRDALLTDHSQRYSMSHESP